jgi:hypothetical protein
VTGNRSAAWEAQHESLDVAFRLRPERPSDGGVFPPARRVGEVLHAVASALREIPFGDVHGIEIRRIAGLTVEPDASLDAPIEVRARAVDDREPAPGRRLVVIHCELANQLGERLAAFSVETEAGAGVPAGSVRPYGAEDRLAASDPELECVDNIPV